ncbi:MAG: ATP-binding cassette domain-containing protein [Myxococcales bacterium]|nr:MAG: ATP-binding cassette domain-containing protein [Myxococcales bacterium]
MIEARNLTKDYESVRAVDAVSFDVHKGEVLGFLGPNGAGKTTTMKILTGFIAPSEGNAKVNGFDVFEDSLGVRKSIGYLPEHTPLYTEMVVYEYLNFMAEMRGLEGNDLRASIKRVVEQTALGDMISREIRTLSRGYRQRVGLAQALIHEPPILILDEPLSGLDPNQAAEIRDLIKDIGKERTIIYSTHNLAEVQMTCKRVLIIAQGKLVADDSTERLRERAGHSKHLVTVLTKGDEATAQTAKAAFGKIEHASAVNALQSSDSELRLEVIPSDNQDLSAEIFKAAVAANLVLTELHREGQDLEEVFRELTLQNDSSKAKNQSAAKAA